ncbi:MAG TPA: hypothetical protein VEK15_26445 [Vicinamibacteria bacterium]|nr:hypothetical protein [Vicinamibacteria bacterium]
MSRRWKSESWTAAAWDHLHRGRHVLLGTEPWIFRQRSEFQDVAIAQVPEFGKGLFLDANVQFLEMDEFVYHEAFALPPLLFHPDPTRVLIAGGGDGLALREVLRDPRVGEVVLVEIDSVVVEACRQHLSSLHRGSFESSRANILIDDALTYLASSSASFDVILLDLLDGYDEAGLDLYQKILPLAKNALRVGGIVGGFGELARPHMPVWWIRRGLMRHFANVVCHRAAIESFASSYAFLLASDSVDFQRAPRQSLMARAEALDGELRSLVPDLYPSSFRLPRYLQDVLDGPPPPAPHGEIEWLEL